MTKLYLIFILLLLLLSCSDRNPQNPFDPEVDISVKNLTYERLAIDKIKLSWENRTSFSNGILKIDKKVENLNWQESVAVLNSNATTWADTLANINQNLKYRIFVYFDENQFNIHETNVIDNTIPAPENLTFTIVNYSGTSVDIHLFWDYDAVGIDGFKVEKNGTLLTEIIPAGTTEWIDLGLTMNLTYSYRVLAFYQMYNSAYSNNVTWSIPVPEGMIFVLGGTFDMGDHYNEGSSDELPVHSVYLDSYYINKYEVTQTEYEAVVGSNPSYFGGNNLPVEQVSSFDAITFCNLKSQQEGLTPCYNLDDWSCDFSANGYRLPTEAEWEYAARGGVNWTDDYKYSGTTNELGMYAWYSLGETHPIGTKLPNQLEIHDMSGNVLEWCWDRHDTIYYQTCQNQGTVLNPTGPGIGNYRVLRGGSWVHNGFSCRVAARNYNNFYSFVNHIGFRLARSFE